MSFEVISYKNYQFIKIKKGNIDATFCSLGASIYSIKFCGNIMTLGPKNKDSFLLDNIYYGKTIGRVANRIKSNKIVINNQTYVLLNNENENTLHGGLEGISTKNFKFNIHKYKDFTKIVFSYLSKHLESGFPGNLNIKISYLVYDNSIKIIQEGISDEDTVLSLTNHTYYSLNNKNVENLKLTIDSSRYVYPNPVDLVLEDIRKVDDTLNFKKGRLIGMHINDQIILNTKACGYDYFYLFDNPKKRIKVRLESSFFKLDLSTNYDGVQIYTDNYEDGIECETSSNKKRRGIAIEPGYVTNKLNLIKKGKKYKRYIGLKFSRK